MSSLGEAVIEVGADTSAFRGEVKAGTSAALNNAGKSMQNLGRKMSGVGRNMTLGITAPLLGIAAAGLKTAGEFEQTMNVLQAATNSTSGDMLKLREQAIGLGADTVFSANEAADGMLELGKAGFSTAETMKAIPEVLNLAATEGLALGDSAGIVSSALSQFSLEAEDAGQVVNALAGASNASRASVATLSESLKLAGSAASGVGLDVQETAGVLAALADSGLDGSVAGTSLAAMFNKLVPQTKKAQSAMEELGLDFVKGNGQFEDITNIAQQLQDKLVKLSPAARKVKLSAIFGNDASTLAAVNAVMKEGAKGIADYTQAARDSGAAQKLADARMKGFKGTVEKLSGSLETAGLAVGEALIPFMTKAADVIGDLSNKFTAMDPEQQKIIIGVAALAAAAGPLLIVTGSLVSAYGTLSLATTGLIAKTALLKTTMSTSAGAMGLLGGVAKKAAGVGGVLALGDALIDASKEGQNFGNTMQAAAGGAGIGFMVGGPIGAAVGALVGGGAASLAGAFAKTSAEASAARIEIAKTAGFESAQEGAKKLAESLTGVINAYGAVPRAAVRASFFDDKGTLDAGIAQLREWGVSMDTITSAAMGNAQAQQVVDAAYQTGKGTLRGYAAEAKAAYDNVKDGARDAVDAQGQVIKNGEHLSNDQVKIYEDAWLAASEALKKAKNSQDAFTARSTKNVDAIQAQQKKQKELAATLGITNKAFRQFSEPLRKKLEVDGLPQTIKDSFRLVNQYKDLQTFKNIKTVLEASGAELTNKQVETLREKYKDILTKKQINTIIKAVGVTEETQKAKMYQDALDRIRDKTITVTTQYRYVGKRSGGGEGSDADFLPRLAAGAAALTKTIPGVVSAINLLKTLSGSLFTAANVGAATSAAIEGFQQVTDAAKEATEQRLAYATAATERELAQGKNALARDFAEREKALKKKYGGKGEEKMLRQKLDALGKMESSAIKDLEKMQRQAVGRLKESSKVEGAALQALANAQRTAIMAQTAAWDALAVTLEGVRQKYTDALTELTTKIAEFNALAKSVGDSLIKSVFGAGMADVPPSFDAMITSLTDQEAAAKRYGEVMEQLAALNLNATSFQQIADEGVDGLAAAEALLASGQAGVAQVNDLQKSINTYAEKAGNTVATYLLGAGVQLAQSTVDSFATQEATLVAQMAVLGTAIATAFAKAMATVVVPVSGLPSGGGGGGGGADGPVGKHKWEPISKSNKRCSVCGKARSNAIHTNRNDNNAAGNLSSMGGWAMVGERGRELVRLPGGSRVYPAQQTERMGQQGGQAPTINVTVPTSDPEAAAMAVANRWAERT